MAQGYHEQGIKNGEDYGTQFLNARKDGGAGGNEPPKDVPSPPPPPGGRSVGQILMIALIVLAVVGGGAAALILSTGGDDVGDDLIAEGDEVAISDHDRQAAATTTTEEPETTTTTAAPTTTTTTPASTTTQSTAAPTTTVPPTQAPTSAAVACPGGFAGTQLTVSIAALPQSQFRVTVNGATTNSTTAAINLQLTVPIGGSEGTTNIRPDKYGASVRPGATLNWTATTIVTSDTQPDVNHANGSWTWTDPKFSGCATGTFG
jgi:hypothetical protein